MSDRRFYMEFLFTNQLQTKVRPRHWNWGGQDEVEYSLDFQSAIIAVVH